MSNFIPSTQVGSSTTSDETHHRSDGALGVQFLLAEFNELAETWRHTDARIETAINFYLTTGAIVLPGLALLYQAVQNLQLFILATIPILAVLFFMGVFLTRRITNANFLKAQYNLASQFIRRYFVDHAPEIARYIQLPIAPPLDSVESQNFRLAAPLHRRVIFAVNVFNSFLVGISVVGIIWVLFRYLFLPIGIVIIGLLASGLTFLVLNWFFIRRIRRSI